MVKNNLKNTTSGKKIDFPIPVMGGGSDNPAEFNYDIFSFRRITLAPIVVLIGFGFVFWAIMRKPKKEMEEGTKD